MPNLQFRALHQIAARESGVDRIEHALFVRAPERRDEVALGAVAGQAVDDHLRWEYAQTLLEQVDIVLRREHLALPGSIICRQIRAAHAAGAA